MNVLGIAGLAGSGKGVVATTLEDRFEFQRVSFADEIKRTIRRWWPNFTTEECWGPSDARSRAHAEYGGLSVRRAAQLIGTEVGRALDSSVWARLGLDTARRLLEGGCWYEPQNGLVWSASARRPRGVVFDDVRFGNEIEAIHNARGKVWKLVRPEAGLEGEAAQHTSETSLASIEDASFDAIIINNKSIADLDDVVCRIATATL